MKLTPRTDTPDVITYDDEGHKSARIKLKRACNGCGQLLGDVDDRDVDDNGDLTDVRGECPNCRPVVEAELAGCRTWQLTPRSHSRIDHDIDTYGVYAKAYWQDVDGKLAPVGLRIGQYPGHVVAFYGDWIIRHPDGGFTVHKAPSESKGTAA